MSVTSGFFNALNHDRTYNALQMSMLFDGLIRDGIFASIGTCFVVKAHEGLSVNVGIGRAWFDHTWIYNDAIEPVTLEESEILQDRIDAIVLDIDSTEAVRNDSIKVIKGTASTSPSRPALVNENEHHQYPLAYIYRKAGSTEITQADITDMVGTEATPFVTGILDVISVDTLLGQWQDQMDQFVDGEEADFSSWYQSMIEQLEQKAQEMDDWTDSEQTSFVEWLETLKGKLDEEPASHLQKQIDDHEVERILMVGLTDGVKTFSDDGTVITTVDSERRKLVKTFSNGFLTCKSVLTDSHDTPLGSMTKTFSADGKTISTEVVIGQAAGG